MRIHNYQIHNALNGYHRQLSQPSGRVKAKIATTAARESLTHISIDGKRQPTFDKISTEIVDRMIRLDSANQYAEVEETDGVNTI